MRDFWKKTAFLAAIGFVLGVVVGLVFMAIGGIREYLLQNGSGRLALYLVLSGAIGAINIGFTTIYDLESWSLARATLTHFCIAMSVLCAVGFWLGWLSLHSPYTWWMLMGCVILYFIIWLVMYLKYKSQVRKINQALKDWKRRGDGSSDSF